MQPIKIVIIMLWVGSVVDPVGYFYGIRYIALIAMLLAVGYLFVTGKTNILKFTIQGVMIVLLGGLLPIYGFTLYSFRAGSGEFIDTSYIASGVLMLGSLLYVNKKMVNFGVEAMVFSGRLLVLLVGLLFVAQLNSFGDIINFLVEKGIAYVGYRDYSGIKFPYLYLVASPILILLLAYDFCKLRRDASMVNFMLFMLTALALALTGTRAHMLISLSFIFLYTILTGDKIKVFWSLFFLIMSSLLAVVFSGAGDLIGSFFSSAENSNSLKLSMLYGYAEIFSNPAILIFGQGFNAHEWSINLREMISMDVGASKTELTYIELIRVFGVVIGSFFLASLCFLLVATKAMVPEFEWVYPGFFILLINASVNPYLFSTNGILPLGLIAAMVSQSVFLKVRSSSLNKFKF